MQETTFTKNMQHQKAIVTVIQFKHERNIVSNVHKYEPRCTNMSRAYLNSKVLEKGKASSNK